MTRWRRDAGEVEVGEMDPRDGVGARRIDAENLHCCHDAVGAQSTSLWSSPATPLRTSLPCCRTPGRHRARRGRVPTPRCVVPARCGRSSQCCSNGGYCRPVPAPRTGAPYRRPVPGQDGSPPDGPEPIVGNSEAASGRLLLGSRTAAYGATCTWQLVRTCPLAVITWMPTSCSSGMPGRASLQSKSVVSPSAPGVPSCRCS